MGLRSTRWSALAIAGALALGVAACGGDDEPDRQRRRARTEADAKPLKIGASLPLTGDFSEPGKAAKQGYEVWQSMINEKGGLLGRKVELVIKDDASNQNTVVSDYNALISSDKVDLLLGTFSSLLNLPASAVAERAQMVYVEPAGGNPDIFKRGFKTVFFSQQATAAHQGDTWANYIAALPDDKRPEDRRLPDARRPVHDADVGGHRGDPQGGRDRDRLPRDLHRPTTKNFDAIANAVKAKNPDLVVAGTQFEDGVGFMRALSKVGFTPKWLYQTNAPSFGDQYAEGVGAENTEGVFYAVSHSQDSDTPGNPEFVAKYKEMFGGENVPEDAADAYAAAQVLQATVEANKTVEKADQLKLADWIRTNTVPTILGDLSWNEDGSPKGEFLVGQWQGGKPVIVLPEDAATSDTIIEGYKPGGTS